MTATGDAPVERLLRATASAATWPPTPDLRERVLARLEVAPGGEAPAPIAIQDRGDEGRQRRLTLVRAVALAVLALLLLAGVAAALGFRLPGLDIVFVERLPPAGAGLNLGSPIPIADARSLDRPRVLQPSTLPEPDVAYVLGSGDRRIVTLAWRAAAGEATLPGSDLSLTVMAVPGTTSGPLATKEIGPGTTVEPVTVGRSPGWWISGAPHQILVQRPDGEIDVLSAALAGDTLVFARDGTLYRLESALGRDATIEVADSLR